MTEKKKRSPSPESYLTADSCSRRRLTPMAEQQELPASPEAGLTASNETLEDTRLVEPAPEFDIVGALPPEVAAEILYKLPTQTITDACKCVSDAWLRQVIALQLSNQNTHLAVLEFDSPGGKPYKIVELVDGRRWHAIFNFKLPFKDPLLMHSAANGLLFLGAHFAHPIIIVNPMTREFITVPSPQQPSTKPLSETYGFGVSKTTGDNKLVRISAQSEGKLACQVYTVGTGSWRTITSQPHLCSEDKAAAFVNGNLHWFEQEKKGASRRICCVDVSTEHFSSFSLPPPLDDDGQRYCNNLCVLDNRLCICSSSIDGIAVYEIKIWLMKDYADHQSWYCTNKFIINKSRFPSDFVDHLHPVKVFEDGDVLMSWRGMRLVYFSGKTSRIGLVYVSRTRREIMCYTTVYSPSHVRLKTLEMEKVSSF